MSLESGHSKVGKYIADYRRMEGRERQAAADIVGRKRREIINVVLYAAKFV